MCAAISKLYTGSDLNKGRNSSTTNYLQGDRVLAIRFDADLVVVRE